MPSSTIRVTLSVKLAPPINTRNQALSMKVKLNTPHHAGRATIGNRRLPFTSLSLRRPCHSRHEISWWPTGARRCLLKEDSMNLIVRQIHQVTIFSLSSEIQDNNQTRPKTVKVHSLSTRPTIHKRMPVRPPKIKSSLASSAAASASFASAVTSASRAVGGPAAPSFCCFARRSARHHG